MHRMSLSFALCDVWTRAYPQPLVYSVLRSEFDYYLLRRAEGAGVVVYQPSVLRGLDLNGGGPVSVRIDGKEFRAQCLVGADGANSVVRGFLNGRQDYFWQAAVYCEVPDELVNPDTVQQDCMMVDWGTLPSGYAWVFPKVGYVNIGAGGPVTIARHFRRYVTTFINARRLLKSSLPERLSLVGHQLPTLTGRTRLAGKRMVLVGDAAGLVEPFTGDGISFACQSARVASDCIYRALSSGVLDLNEYHDQLIAQLGGELLWSRKLLSISTSFPWLIHRLFKNNDRVWQTFCQVLRGEESFQRLKKDVLGPFEFAWKAIDLFTQLRERNILSPKSLARQLREFT